VPLGGILSGSLLFPEIVLSDVVQRYVSAQTAPCLVRGDPRPPVGRERGPSTRSPRLPSRNPSPQLSSELDHSCACAYTLCKELMLCLNIMPVTYFPEAMDQVSLSVPLCYSCSVIDYFFIYNSYILCL